MMAAVYADSADSSRSCGCRMASAPRTAAARGAPRCLDDCTTKSVCHAGRGDFNDVLTLDNHSTEKRFAIYMILYFF
jgi:hypothetical protein